MFCLDFKSFYFSCSLLMIGTLWLLGAGSPVMSEAIERVLGTFDPCQELLKRTIRYLIDYLILIWFLLVKFWRVFFFIFEGFVFPYLIKIIGYLITQKLLISCEDCFESYRICLYRIIDNRIHTAHRKQSKILLDIEK